MCRNPHWREREAVNHSDIYRQTNKMKKNYIYSADGPLMPVIYHCEVLLVDAITAGKQLL